jgi:hypothetical protein
MLVTSPAIDAHCASTVFGVEQLQSDTIAPQSKPLNPKSPVACASGTPFTFPYPPGLGPPGWVFGNAALPFVRFVTPKVSFGDKTPALLERKFPQILKLADEEVAGRKPRCFGDTVSAKRLRNLVQHIFRRVGLLDRLNVD